MRKPTRFGFSGVLACVCFFCLSTATALPQEAKPAPSPDAVADEEPPLPAAAMLALRQLQEQNLAVLKALEQLREDRDGALNRYTETLSIHLNALKDAFSFQGQQQLQMARSSNHFIITVAAALAGLAVLVMLLSALLPV